MFLLVQIVYEPLQSCSSQSVSDKNVWTSVAKFTLSCQTVTVLTGGWLKWDMRETHPETNCDSLSKSMPHVKQGKKAFLQPQRTQQIEAIPQNFICTESYTAAAKPSSVYVGPETLYKLNSYETNFKASHSLGSLVLWDLDISCIHPGNLFWQK